MIESNYNSQSHVFSDILFAQVGPDNLPLLYFPGLAQYQELLHFITTRHGGYSEKPFHTFNLAAHVGDRPEFVHKNRIKLAQSLGITTQNFIFANQRHGTNVSLIEQRARNEDTSFFTQVFPDSDALVTTCRDICLLIFIADCVPVLLFDRKRKVIALVHAGWRGTVGLICQKTVQLMQSHYGSRAQDIVCAIGPAIGPCCYQVGREVLVRVRESFPDEENLIISRSTGEKAFFDLWQANKIQLLRCGIPQENIKTACLCTCCHSNLFFSNRKEQPHTGRFAAGIMLRK
ncbi:MAG: peptidoglycan editing factor PgeF [Candidatus Caldatribacteriota bacterium]